MNENQETVTTNSEAVVTPVEPVTPASEPDVSSSDTTPVEARQPGDQAEPQSMLEAVTKVVAEETEPDVLEQQADKPKEPSGDPDEKTGLGEDGQEQQAGEAKQDGAEDAEATAKAEQRRRDIEESKATSDFTERDMQALPKWAARKVKHLQTQHAEAQQYADVSVKLSGFLQENDIDKDQFNALLSVGAALSKGDFNFARQIIEPYWDLIMQATGGAVSPELRRMVDEGHMTEDAARRMTAEYIGRKQAEINNERMVTRQNQQRQQAHERASVDTVVNAVNTWEQRIRQSDPDYDRKQDAVRDALQALRMEHGEPPDADHAVAMANAAYERVNAQVRRFQPQRQATNPSPSSVNQSPTVSRDPQSLEDAMLAGLASARS